MGLERSSNKGKQTCVCNGNANIFVRRCEFKVTFSFPVYFFGLVPSALERGSIATKSKTILCTLHSSCRSTFLSRRELEEKKARENREAFTLFLFLVDNSNTANFMQPFTITQKSLGTTHRKERNPVVLP